MMHFISPKILNEQAISKKSKLETYIFMLFCDKFVFKSWVQPHIDSLTI